MVLRASRLRPGDRDSVFAGAPAYNSSSFCGSLAVELYQLLLSGGSLLASAILSALLAQNRRCSQRSFGVGATFRFHICKPCYPGSGWGRQLWPARYPGLGDCWGLVGVGESL